MWPAILLILCGSTPIFEASPDNPWDALRGVFYSHTFTNGKAYEHEESLDHAPWTTWAPFYKNDNFNAHVLFALARFLKQPNDAVELQPAVRRAVLLRDLWPVFDAQTEGNRFDAPTQDDSAANGAAAKRQAELRVQVARVMRRLELSDAEAKGLPDNFKAAIAAKQFAPAFDPKSPERAFMPSDLFDEAGPWVAIARDPKTIGGQGHAEGVRYRSIFVPYIRVSANRQETLDFLNKYRQTRNKLPKGTLLALIRHMAVPTTSGNVTATPVMESLQLIVVDPPRDHHFKFVLDRVAFIAGQPGLRLLSNDDSVDAYSFESGGLFGFDNKIDADGEELVLGKYAGPIPKGITSLGHCIQCHGLSAGSSLFVNFGEAKAPLAMSRAEQVNRIIAHKEQSAEWKTYQTAKN